jgi:predicted trehalose synthase
MSIDNRRSERLEAGYAITVRAVGAKAAEAFAKATMTNLSQGGLCFIAPYRLEGKQKLEIDFPAFKPVIKLIAVVVWCRPQRDEFSVGAEFTGMSEKLRARLVEMHRAIAEYQKMKNALGTTLDAQQAAAEWLGTYGENFLAGLR